MVLIVESSVFFGDFMKHLPVFLKAMEIGFIASILVFLLWRCYLAFIDEGKKLRSTGEKINIQSERTDKAGIIMTQDVS